MRLSARRSNGTKRNQPLSSPRCPAHVPVPRSSPGSIEGEDRAPSNGRSITLLAEFQTHLGDRGKPVKWMLRGLSGYASLRFGSSRPSWIARGTRSLDAPLESVSVRATKTTLMLVTKLVEQTPRGPTFVKRSLRVIAVIAVSRVRSAMRLIEITAV